MIDLCKEANVPEPQFEEYSGGFSVTFYFPNLSQNNPTSPPKVSNLTNRQKEIINALETCNFLSLTEIVALLQNPPSKETVGDDLTNLKNKGLIQSEGKGRGAKWYISSKK